jgi:hypothetical protein
MNCFWRYGWSSSEFLSSNTKVFEMLRPYLRTKRQHAGDGPGDSTNKRRHVNRPGASTSRSDHDFSVHFSPGRNDQAISIGIDNTVESMLRSDSSRLIPFDARNRMRNLTDPATIDNLDYVFDSSKELTDSATASILGCSVNSSDEFTDLVTASNFNYTTNSWCNIADPVTTSNFSYTANSWCNIADLDMDAFFRPALYQTGPFTEYFQRSVDRSDALTDRSTEILLREATSPTQVYLTENSQYASHLPDASTHNWIRSTDDEQWARWAELNVEA